ncbi:hypothetical protein F4777DRAFT_600928 [Nemania sp. FL0916]|nr:hypothetical protein F4777DRAFT_600928 [Nemania sp. FL0916]
MNSAGEALDLGNYMVLVGAFQVPHNNVESIFHANEAFQFDPRPCWDETHGWAGNNSLDELSGPIFGLRWDQLPKNRRSFIFGSGHTDADDTNECPCDFQLTKDNDVGISRLHFAIDIKPQRDVDQEVEVQISSLNGIVNIKHLSGANWNFTMPVTQGQVARIANSVSVNVGDWMTFRVWIPRFDTTIALKRKRLAYQFYRRCTVELPVRIPGIDPGNPTNFANLRKTDEGVAWLSIESKTSDSSSEMPFFMVSTPDGDRMSAYQRRLSLDCTPVIFEAEKRRLLTYCDISKMLGKHPNVHNFTHVAVCPVTSFQLKVKYPPWLIGDFVEPATITLATYLKQSGNEAVLDKLYILQSVSNAVNYAHSRAVGHGQLLLEKVLITRCWDDSLDVKVFGFQRFAGDDEQELESIMHSDIFDLGRLGVQLFVRPNRGKYPTGVDQKSAWLELATKSDSQVQELLMGLLEGKMSANHAVIFLEGLPKLGKDISTMISNPQNTKRKAEPLELLHPSSFKRLCDWQQPVADGAFLQDFGVSQLLANNDFNWNMSGAIQESGHGWADTSVPNLGLAQNPHAPSDHGNVGASNMALAPQTVPEEGLYGPVVSNPYTHAPNEHNNVHVSNVAPAPQAVHENGYYNPVQSNTNMHESHEQTHNLNAAGANSNSEPELVQAQPGIASPPFQATTSAEGVVVQSIESEEPDDAEDADGWEDAEADTPLKDDGDLFGPSPSRPRKTSTPSEEE